MALHVAETFTPAARSHRISHVAVIVLGWLIAETFNRACVTKLVEPFAPIGIAVMTRCWGKK